VSRRSGRVDAAILSGALASREFVWLVFDGDCNLTAASSRAAELLGGEVEGRAIDEVFADPDAQRLREIAARREALEHAVPLSLLAADGARQTIIARASTDPALVVTGDLPHDDDRRYDEEVHRLNNELGVLTREYQRQARELRAALEARDRSFWHLEKIQEVLPICMDCRTVKPGSDWTDLVSYLQANEIALSHGLCPTCAERRMEELEA
jgi:hypothetical protein